MQRQGWAVYEDTVISAVESPREVFPGYGGRFVAQIILDTDHFLRVVYEENGEITVVPLYPGRRARYET